MTAQQPVPAKNPIQRLWEWIVDGLDRTVFMGVAYTFPKRFVSPLGFLGMLTGITFLVLGITGGLLMIYYQPTLSGCGNLSCAFTSVQKINDSIPYGWLLRNIHYTASNAMVLLAVMHLYYQYFSGRFKIKNEILWVTGVLFGIITGVEAFFGYDLILNQRAGLAIDIGASLANASPVIGGPLRLATFGAGFGDFILRLYSAHVFILPMVMIILTFIHFPRYLVFDVPIISAVTGGIFMVAGVFPVAVGTPYNPGLGQLTIPEWYLTALYALLRTEYDKFVMGGLMPALLFLMAIVIPFVDTSKKLSWKERPFFTALGITSISQIIITTGWGFYINPNTSLPTLARLIVPPEEYFASMIGVTAVSFVVTYAFLRYLRNKERVRKAVAPMGPLLSRRWVVILLFLLVGSQIALNGFAYMAFLEGLRQLALFQVGVILVAFGVIVHLYRYSQNLPF
jgi:ubiquinol-cytochrome c reductase cytochrome b subunit